MCALNRLAIILLISFIYLDLPIWIDIPLIILFGVCGAFADLAESDIKEKIENCDLAIKYKKDYIAEMSKRLDKLEDQINNEGE